MNSLALRVVLGFPRGTESIELICIKRRFMRLAYRLWSVYSNNGYFTLARWESGSCLVC